MSSLNNISIRVTNPILTSNEPQIIILEDSEIFISTQIKINFILHNINYFFIGMSIPIFWINDTKIFRSFVIISGIFSFIATILLYIKVINKSFILFIVNRIKN